jgi:hypothetical protein
VRRVMIVKLARHVSRFFVKRAHTRSPPSLGAFAACRSVFEGTLARVSAVRVRHR